MDLLKVKLYFCEKWRERIYNTLHKNSESDIQPSLFETKSGTFQAVEPTKPYENIIILHTICPDHSESDEKNKLIPYNKVNIAENGSEGPV